MIIEYGIAVLVVLNLIMQFILLAAVLDTTKKTSDFIDCLTAIEARRQTAKRKQDIWL